MNWSKKPKKLVLPVILVLFFLLTLLISPAKKIISEFNFSFFKKEGMVYPFRAEENEEERLINFFTSYGLKPVSLKTTKETREILLHNDLTVYFSRLKDLSSQLASLQVILTRNKIEGKQPKKIDLRFENPVVVF